jgi:hypothetical protein
MGTLERAQAQLWISGARRACSSGSCVWRPWPVGDVWNRRAHRHSVVRSALVVRSGTLDTLVSRQWQLASVHSIAKLWPMLPTQSTARTTRKDGSSGDRNLSGNVIKSAPHLASPAPRPCPGPGQSDVRREVVHGQNTSPTRLVCGIKSVQTSEMGQIKVRLWVVWHGPCLTRI